MNKYIFLFIIPLFVSCENVDMNMYDQVSFRPQEFPRRMNPKGSVPMFGRQKKYDGIDAVTLVPPLFKDKAGSLKIGKKMYNIYCRPCHGVSGHSDTRVAEKFDKRPANLTKASVRTLSDGEIFKRILLEDAAMPGHRNELTDMEAWEIVAYVRQLQNTGSENNGGYK